MQHGHLDEGVIAIRGMEHWLLARGGQRGSNPRYSGSISPKRPCRQAVHFKVNRSLWCAADDHNGQIAQLRCRLAQARLGHGSPRKQRADNRIEGSHRPTRKREQVQGRFKSARQARRLLAVHDETVNLFRPRRHKITASIYSQKRPAAFLQWNECTDKLTAGSDVERHILSR